MINFKRSALSVLLCSCVCFGLMYCGQKGKKIPAATKEIENSITLIALGFADSATQQNKGLGFARYIKVNLDTDSVISFMKYQVWDEADQIKFRREKKSGKIKGALRQEVLSRFLEKAGVYPSGKVSPNIPEGALYCGYNFLAIIKKDGTEKYFSFTSYGLNPAIEEAVEMLLSLPNDNRLKNTAASINEDSILIPLFSRTEFSYILPAPPIRNSVKFIPPPPSSK